MFLHTDRKLLLSHLRPLSVLVLHVLLTHLCTGQPQLIGSSQPIVATLGEDIILPCVLKPATDASDLTLEWTRPDLNPRFVLVWRSGQELEDKKHESFVGRTSLFINELNVGNISLKLSRVKLSDEGTYRCFIPGLGLESFVPLVVGSNVVSSPVVTLAGIDRNRGGLVLQCESEGWYPEPEVSWLDAEGHVLSAGPTETVRGPDGLYTVSSRVTVEERHRNNFTCRVQQKDINQIRETQIHVPDDFFELQSSSSALTVGLAVSLSVCILIILILVFLFWRQNRIKTKRRRGRTDEDEKKHWNKTEDQFVSDEETERETLRTDGTGHMKVFNKHVKIKQAELQQLHDEKQRNEEKLKNLEEQLENLKEQLENKNKEVEDKQAELHEEKQRNEEELKNLKEQLENLKEQLENKDKQENQQEKKPKFKRTGTASGTSTFYNLVTSMMGNKKKVETPKIHQQDSVSRIKEPEDEAVAVNTQWIQTNEELKEARLQLKKKNEENNQLKRDLDEQIWKEKKTGEKAERDLKEMIIKNTELENLLKEEVKKKDEAEKQVENLKKELKTKEASLSSTTGPGVEVEVDQNGKFIRLKNTTEENQQIGGWELKIQINNEEPVRYIFEKSLILSPTKTVSLWVPGFYNHCSHPDRVWMDLKTWSSGNKLQVVLISDTGETQHLALHSVTKNNN